MITVSFSVDAEAANAERGYTDRLVEVAEKADVPLTWLIFVSLKRPMDNARLYHRDYFHRIPSWHEIGLHIHFEESGPALQNPDERSRMIRLGKDVLKQVHVKPTAFRAGRFRLQPSDINTLVEVGILVDSSGVPDVPLDELTRWKKAPAQPYFLSSENLAEEGVSPLLEIPVATHNGKIAYLDSGFEEIKPVLEYHAAHSQYISIGCHDYVDCAETLRQSIELLNQHDARYVTLTQMGGLWKTEKRRELAGKGKSGG